MLLFSAFGEPAIVRTVYRQRYVGLRHRISFQDIVVNLDPCDQTSGCVFEVTVTDDCDGERISRFQRSPRF